MFVGRRTRAAEVLGDRAQGHELSGRPRPHPQVLTITLANAKNPGEFEDLRVAEVMVCSFERFRIEGIVLVCSSS